MPVLSHLGAEARAECLGELAWGGGLAVAAKHGLDAQRLYRARHAHRGRKPPKSSRPIDLPSAGHRRWTPRQKAAVVVALRRDDIAEAEVLARYAMSTEELAGWCERFARVDATGLERVTPRRAPIAEPAGAPA